MYKHCGQYLLRGRASRSFLTRNSNEIDLDISVKSSFCSARAPCHHSRITVWPRAFLWSLRRALRRCVRIRRDYNGGNISLAAYFDPMVTDKTSQ
jgi:hypothetical protein